MIRFKPRSEIWYHGRVLDRLSFCTVSLVHGEIQLRKQIDWTRTEKFTSATKPVENQNNGYQNRSILACWIVCNSVLHDAEVAERMSEYCNVQSLPTLRVAVRANRRWRHPYTLTAIIRFIIKAQSKSSPCNDWLRVGRPEGWSSSPDRLWIFSETLRPDLVPTQPPIHWVLGLFLGVKAPGVSSYPLTSIQCRGQEDVYLYIHCPIRLHCVVLS
jgi:hypothetical protein